MSDFTDELASPFSHPQSVKLPRIPLLLNGPPGELSTQGPHAWSALSEPRIPPPPIQLNGPSLPSAKHHALDAGAKI